MSKKLIIPLFLVGLVIVFGIANSFKGLEFALAILFIITMFGFNIFQSQFFLKKIPTKKFNGYVERIDEDVFYDSRLKTLRKAVVNKELTDLEYKRQRDSLVKGYNEGRMSDKNER